MDHRRPHTTCLLVMGCGLVLGACEGSGGPTPGGIPLASLDLGEGWDRPPEHARADAPEEATWSIVLATFTGPGAEDSAHLFLARSTAITEDVPDRFRVHRGAKGWLVVYGRYEGWEDSAATADIERLRLLARGNRPVFTRTVLSRLARPVSLESLPPLALLTVRRELPEVDPLYTLEVALWGDFESGVLPPRQRRREAESHAKELRLRGHVAWFHHDESRELSVVTVGLFDHTALDARSGLSSSEVEALLRVFPSRLVNGEPILELIDARRPRAGTRPQPPRLVLVPKP